MEKQIILSIALASLAASIHLGFAEEKADKTYRKPTMPTAPELTRVSSKDIEHLTTANDLIDKTVYDSFGEKIGFVKDVSLGVKLGAGMGSSHGAEKPSSSQGRDQSKNSQNKSQSSGSISGIGSHEPEDQEGKYGDISPNDSFTMNMGGHSRQKQYAFISIGGVLGIGDNLIRVPLTSLQHDSPEDRLVLQGYSKATVVAIAEQDPGALDSNDDDDETASRAKRTWEENDKEKKD